jgi:hypothetical protein
MLYLMPIWDWQNAIPSAQQFWKLAHAVARDHNGDDWLAPHMTLHSRTGDVGGLAEKFLALVHDLGAAGWREVLKSLSDWEQWSFDEDCTPKRKPTVQDHYVLHKASIRLPQTLRNWLSENQDPMTLPPRKQDVAAFTRDALAEDNPGVGEKVPVTAPFHISLYSFRAQKSDSMSSSPRFGTMDSLGSHGSADTESAFSTMSLSSTARRRQSTSYKHVVPQENCLAKDLAAADWMLVLVGPGLTEDEPLVPFVLTAVRLQDLASGELPKKLAVPE